VTAGFREIWTKPALAPRYLVGCGPLTSILDYSHRGAIRMRRQRRTTCGTAEAARRIGVSKATLLRWFAQKRIAEVRRDRNNWRVFTDQDLERIKREVMGDDASG
jgi:hypothetical protein